MQTQPNPNRIIIWGCAAVTALGVVMCCLFPLGILAGGAALAGIAESNEVTDTSTEVLAVESETVNLEVTNEVGGITIRGDDEADEIEVEIIKRANGLSEQRARDLLDEIEVNVSRDGDQYIITVDQPDGGAFMENHSVDLRITVPDRLNMDVTGNVGTISVEDVEIINALTLSNDVGAIEFEGQIGPDGTHSITNDVGAIEIELTGESGFSLDAKADVGGIDNQLDLENREQPVSDGPGQTLAGQYGEGDASLTITSNVGGITLKD